MLLRILSANTVDLLPYIYWNALLKAKHTIDFLVKFLLLLIII